MNSKALLLAAGAALGTTAILWSVQVSLSAPVQRGGDYELTWSTNDGGGVMLSTGGDYELSDTLGQPDAGSMNGGGYELTGSFWFQIAPGDCNNDGGVNLFDYGDFVSCVTGPDSTVPAGCECFDVNRSGTVDLLDFAIAQTTFTGS